jgi:hypothetical protein
MASWTILIARSRSSGGYLFWDVLDAMTPSSFPSDGASTIPRAIQALDLVELGLAPDEAGELDGKIVLERVE